MQKLLKVSQQTFWQVFGKIVTSLSSFIILGLIARNYGEVGTGIYTLAVTYLAIFFILSDFGFNAHILRRIQNKDNLLQRNEFKKLLGTRVVWSAILVLISVAILPFLPFATEQFKTAVVWGSLTILVYGVFVTCNLIFQSRLKYELSVLAVSAGSIVWLIIVLWFVNLKLPIPYLVLTHLLAWIVIVAVALFLLKKLIHGFWLEFRRSYTIRLFKQSWPLAATLVLNVVYFRVDAFMLSYFKGAFDTGIYNLAYQVFQSILVLPTFVMNSFYPMMLQTLKINVEKFNFHIRLAAFGLFLISALILLITYILSPFVVSVITGSGFTDSAFSLRILSLGFPAYFLSALALWIMVAKRMYKQMVTVYSVGLIFNILANLIFIPQYSYLAASWITGISEYLILGVQVLILWRQR